MRRLWLLFFCKHERTRCVHGDEIVARNWRRIACMECDRSLKGDLPTKCHVSGRDHLV